MILETSTEAAPPSDIMMTVASGAVSILENMHAEGISKGPHRVINTNSAGQSQRRRSRSKKPDIAVKCVHIYQHDKCGFEIVFLKYQFSGKGHKASACCVIPGNMVPAPQGMGNQ